MARHTSSLVAVQTGLHPLKVHVRSCLVSPSLSWTPFPPSLLNHPPHPVGPLGLVHREGPCLPTSHIGPSSMRMWAPTSHYLVLWFDILPGFVVSLL